MLGVAPDASHDEVRRAYTARALRLHPDRQAGASPREVERAEWRMKELNAAWAVLRDPDRRRRYDLELRADRRVSTGPRSRPAAWTAPARRPADDDLLQPEPASGVGRREPRPRGLVGVVRFAPLVVILVVLAAILVLSAVVAPDEEGDDPDVVTTEALPVGRCVVLQPAVRTAPDEPAGTPLVIEVDCSLPNAGRVVEKVPFPTPCPTGTNNVPIPADGISVCLLPPR